MIHRAFCRCHGFILTTVLAVALGGPAVCLAADAPAPDPFLEGEPAAPAAVAPAPVAPAPALTTAPAPAPVVPAQPAAPTQPVEPADAPLPLLTPPAKALPPLPPSGPRPAANPRIAQINPVTHLASGAARDGLTTPFAANAWTAQDFVHEQLVRSTGAIVQESAASAVQSNGPGGDTPNIRGFSGAHNLLLIDGVPLNNAATGAGPGFAWNSIDPFDVSRLELLRSPGAGRFGSDAVGAVANATLIGSEDFAHASGQAGLLQPLVAHVATRLSAAENSHAEHGDVSYAKDAFQFLFGVGFKQAGDIQSAGSPGLQTKTGFEQHDLLAKGGVEITPRDRVYFAYNHFEVINAPDTNQTGAGKPWKGSTTGTDIYNRSNFFRDLFYARYVAEDAASVFERLAITASVTRTRLDTDRRDAGFEHINTSTTVTTPGIAAELTGRPVSFGNAGLGQLSGGAEFFSDQVQSNLRDYTAAGAVNEIGLQGPVADDAAYSRFGLFLQYEQWLREQFDLTASVRFSTASATLNRIDTDARPGSSFQTQGSLQDTWQNISFNLRGLQRVNEFDAVYVALSESFRMPNLIDLSTLQNLGGLGREIPNAHTSPERFVTFEVGNRVATPHVTGQAALFYTHMADLLELASVGGGFFQTRNAGNGDVYGLELEGVWDVYGTVQHRALRGVSVFGNFTWQQGFARQFSAFDGKHHRQWLTGMPPTMLMLGGRYDVPGHPCFGELVLRYADVQDRLSSADRQNTSAIPPGGTPGYFLVTVRAGGAMVFRGVPVQASLAVENLFNRNYRVHGSGTNEPGTNIVATIEAGL